MNWKKINKENSFQPEKGNYKKWKDILKKEGFDQCVYCSIHDSRLGGPRNFTVEHYKPKSKFDSLKNNIKNLYYACCICNSFKGDDWPTDDVDNFDNIGYPDPSEIDYSSLFEKIEENCELIGKYTISKYMIIKLYLNRPQLIMDRRLNLLEIQEKILSDKLFFYKDKLVELAKNGNKTAIDFLDKFLTLNEEMKKTIQNTYKSTPYISEEIKR